MPKVRYVIEMVCFTVDGVVVRKICRCDERENAEWIRRGLSVADKMHTYNVLEVLDISGGVK